MELRREYMSLGWAAEGLRWTIKSRISWRERIAIAAANYRTVFRLLEPHYPLHSAHCLIVYRVN